ncbi:manganese efflux pump MntP [Bdellovibrio svalbardensis]|uniref:Manganese efflux pump MntP family protein n=1 Tax=Bdellovibrio svalbardensis TaxID=2972972 RepID=A0ABT6DGG0_9BACT|nr:manganese efflux pump [Bdellovibrio svalbardensis]MDG0815920.1 manganese efflux pump MntP family protein [Bdellovibrio svalbardensis]
MLLEVLVLGLVLSADSFSAALAMGSRPFTKNDALKFALSSGGAELIATLVGFLAGSHIISMISSIDHWIAFGLLAAVAIHMAMEGIEGLRHPHKEAEEVDFHSFTKVLIVSFATSLDAFGVGVTLGVANKPIIPFLASIGLWAFVATLVGLYLAKRLSDKMGPIFTLVAAAILGFLSIQMLKI